MGLVALLVSKDLKEMLRDRRVLISILIPMVVLPVIGFGVSKAMSTSGKVSLSESAVVNMDKGILGAELAEELSKMGAVSKTGDPAKLLEDYKLVVYIPENFTDGLLRGRGGVLLYARYGGGVIPPAYEDVEDKIRNLTAILLMEHYGVKVGEELLNVRREIFVGSRLLDEEELMAMVSISAIGLMLVLIVPMGVAASIAVAIGNEKEKKALEFLLSTPISFGKLLVAKVVSSSILTLIQLAALGVGLGVYTSMMFSSLQALAQTSSSLAPVDVMLMGGLLADVLLVTIPLMFLTTGISLAISLQAEDVRSAQSTVPNVVFPLVLPAFFLYFVPVSRLGSLGSILYWYPYAHPLLIPLEALGGNPYFTGIAFAYDTLLATLVFLAITKFMTSERVLTGGGAARRRVKVSTR